MNNPVRFGIIGCGEAGQSLGGKDEYNGIGEIHASYIKELDGAELVAVADIKEKNAKALAKKFSIGSWCTDYHRLLARNDVDVVCVCTPSGTHGEIAVAAARAGKHVVVEKPMDVTLRRAETIAAACREANVKLQVVFPFRFTNSVKHLKRALEKGVFGNLILVNAMCRRFRNQEYYAGSSWRGTRAMDGGGALMNQGIHILDILLHLAGPVQSVCARTDALGHAGLEVEDVAAAVVRFENGAIGVAEATTCAYPDHGDRIDLHGSKGSIVLEGLPPRIVSCDLMEDDGTSGALRSCVEEPRPYFTHKLVIQDMMEAVRENREPAVNGDEGLMSIRLIEAIYRSAGEDGAAVIP